jgi:Rrf2 family transcriptional regulator, iron-sulfur cluster assembly transcription factor
MTPVRQDSTATAFLTPDSPQQMALLSRKGLLAIGAVIDIALHAGQRPVSARALAERNGLPPRHLEPVLQALVREGILKGIRGPGGGYELAGARRDITAESILRAASSVDEDEDPAAMSIASPMLTSVVLPAISQAEKVFCEALARISIEDMVVQAEAAMKPGL